MSVISLPAAFVPEAFKMKLNVNQRVDASNFGGSEQAIDLLNDRWIASATVGESSYEDGSELEAFIGAMRGHVNTTPLYHFARPAPRGTVRGTLTLNAAAAQGAASLSVTGAFPAFSTVKAGDLFGVGGLLVMAASDAMSGGVNLLKHSESLATSPWTGTPSTTIAAETHNGCVFTTLAKTVATTSEWRGQDFGAVSDGSAITGSFALLAGTSTQVQFGLFDFILSGWGSAGGGVGTVVSGPGVITGDTGVFAVTGLSATVPTVVKFTRTFATASTGGLLIYPDQAVSVTIGKSIKVACTQVEPGTIASTYTPTTASPATGDIVIPITNRLRVAQSSGAAVTWDKPTFNARLLDTSGVEYRSAVTEPVSFDFGEKI